MVHKGDIISAIVSSNRSSSYTLAYAYVLFLPFKRWVSANNGFNSIGNLIDSWSYNGFSTGSIKIPKNGYLFMYLALARTSGLDGQSMNQEITINNKTAIVNSCCTGEGKYQTSWIPVKKGDVVSYYQSRTYGHPYNEAVHASLTLYDYKRWGSANGGILYPDWSKGKQILYHYTSNWPTPQKATINENGFLYADAFAMQGVATITLNGTPIAHGWQNSPGVHDHAITIVPCKKGDIVYAYKDISDYLYEAGWAVYFFPYRRWSSANCGMLYPDWNKGKRLFYTHSTGTVIINDNGYIVCCGYAEGGLVYIYINDIQILNTGSYNYSASDLILIPVKKGDKITVICSMLTYDHKDAYIDYYPYRR